MHVGWFLTYSLMNQCNLDIVWYLTRLVWYLTSVHVVWYFIPIAWCINSIVWYLTPWKARVDNPSLFSWWPTIYDAGPTLNCHWVNASFTGSCSLVSYSWVWCLTVTFLVCCLCYVAPGPVKTGQQKHRPNVDCSWPSFEPTFHGEHHVGMLELFS